MSDAKKRIDPVVSRMQRLLSGPERPGQTFTMPGTNFDGLYRMARRIRAALADDGDDNAPVCMGTDDRSVLAAAMLASLAGGPQLLVPRSLSPDALLDLRERTGFTLVIGHPDHGIPGGVTVIDPQALTDEVETLASEDGAEPDRPWIHLFTGGSGAAFRANGPKPPATCLGEVDALIDRFEVGSGDRFLSTIPALNTYGLIFSLLLPLAASARVVRATPSLPDAIRQQAADASPTLLVSVPDHLPGTEGRRRSKGLPSGWLFHRSTATGRKLTVRLFPRPRVPIW
jgi:hypothetical protein